VALRLDEETLAWVDELAAEVGLNRSEAMRLMLTYARREMPRTYATSTTGES
jgi:antitoxin component of RelBE/YafQ-DinJ toxin-antitoxin module